MRFSVYQESHIGGRKTNQDRMGYSYTRDALLLLLADGMGGHVRGDAAATIAMQTIGSLFQQWAEPYIKKPEQFLEDSFYAAHREMHRYRITHDLPETPRTTVVACLIQHNTALWAHCGDSRLYWMRQGEILARTRDHSRVEALIAQGKIDASERDTHPERNKLYNCVGGPILPVVEISRRVSLQAGDVMLLCSDGLWSVLPEQTLVHSLNDHTIVRAVPELIVSAVGVGGKNGDNVTALAMTWESSDVLHEQDSSIATNTLAIGSVATTIVASRPGDAGDEADGEAGGERSGAVSDAVNGAKDGDLHDERAIEKAIQEIREAIEKSSRISQKISRKNQ